MKRLGYVMFTELLRATFTEGTPKIGGAGFLWMPGDQSLSENEK